MTAVVLSKNVASILYVRGTEDLELPGIEEGG